MGSDPSVTVSLKHTSDGTASWRVDRGQRSGGRAGLSLRRKPRRFVRRSRQHRGFTRSSLQPRPRNGLRDASCNDRLFADGASVVC